MSRRKISETVGENANAVELESLVYGTERFRYDTHAEAVKGFNRVAQNARAQTRKDGLRRSVRLITRELTVEAE